MDILATRLVIDDAEIVSSWVRLNKPIRAHPTSCAINEKKGDPLRWSLVWCQPRSLQW